MAVRLTSASSQSLSVSSSTGIDPKGPYTVSLWVYFVTLPTASALISISNDLDETVLVLTNGSNLQIQVSDSGGSDTVTGVATLSTNTWYFITLVKISSGPFECFINSDIEISSSYSTSGWNFGSTQTRRFGVDFADRFYLNGRLWGIKVWNTALTDLEMRREMICNRPRKAAFYWYPLLSNNTLKDYVNGADLTASNSYTNEDPPAVAFTSSAQHIIHPIESVDFSTSIRNAWLDAIEATFTDADIILEVRTGPPPSNCAASDTGSVLVSFLLPEDWLANASNGFKDKLGTWIGQANASGSFGHFRIKQLGACYIQGSISTPGMGGDMIVNGPSIISGQNLIVNSATFSSFD